MKILLIKMSSMGDLVHNCPLVSDIQRHLPHAQIDWVAEEAYQAIPQLHPGVRRVLPIAWRRWRKNLLQASTWREMAAFKKALQENTYDFVLDTQGLWKSAIVARWANSKVIVGGDGHSIKEGAAACLYDRRLAIAKSLHVIERCRRVGAMALGYALDVQADAGQERQGQATQGQYGIRAQPLQADWLPTGAYAVLMHAASRPEKLWSNAHWLSIGQYLMQQGLNLVLPWGNQGEAERSQALVYALNLGQDATSIAEPQRPRAVVPPLMRLDVAARFLAGAQLVVGLDTGFTHLAAALGRPTIGIFCDSDSSQAAVVGDGLCFSFGRPGQPPSCAQIMAALAAMGR
ncbi:MAG: lipopolysaccharide heptosyltransferase I [Pseudomonadota bacterium]